MWGLMRWDGWDWMGWLSEVVGSLRAPSVPIRTYTFQIGRLVRMMMRLRPCLFRNRSFHYLRKFDIYCDRQSWTISCFFKMCVLCRRWPITCHHPGATWWKRCCHLPAWIYRPPLPMCPAVEIFSSTLPMANVTEGPFPKQQQAITTPLFAKNSNFGIVLGLLPSKPNQSRLSNTPHHSSLTKEESDREGKT